MELYGDFWLILSNFVEFLVFLLYMALSNFIFDVSIR